MQNPAVNSTRDTISEPTLQYGQCHPTQPTASSSPEPSPPSPESLVIVSLESMLPELSTRPSLIPL